MKKPGTKAKLDYKYIRYWSKQYNKAGQPDQRGVLDFGTVEPAHMVKGLRAELYQISKGNYDEKVMNDLVGKKRIIKHGSYDNWAKLMLLWLLAVKG